MVCMVCIRQTKGKPNLTKSKPILQVTRNQTKCLLSKPILSKCKLVCKPIYFVIQTGIDSVQTVCRPMPNHIRISKPRSVRLLCFSTSLVSKYFIPISSRPAAAGWSSTRALRGGIACSCSLSSGSVGAGSLSDGASSLSRGGAGMPLRLLWSTHHHFSHEISHGGRQVASCGACNSFLKSLPIGKVLSIFFIRLQHKGNKLLHE